MGSSVSRHKRKAAKLERKSKPRLQRKRILIVTEDTTSSLDYLKAYWKNLHGDKDQPLASSVVLMAGKHSSPDHVWQTAKEELDAARKKGDAYIYDAVYCVIDADPSDKREKQILFNAINSIRSANRESSETERSLESVAIVSNPCFEYWILLMFQDTSKPFARKGKGVSICDTVIQEFKSITELNNYEKSYVDRMKKLAQDKERIHAATSRAKKYLGNDLPEKTLPSTNFYTILEALEEQAKPVK